MAEKIKATARQARATRGGKAFNANHNTDEKVRAAQPHIDIERMKYNLYIEIGSNLKPIRHEGGKGGYRSSMTEKMRYRELYGDGLEARNARYREKGKKDNIRTISELIQDPKTAPIEGLYQIGNMNTDLSKQEMHDKLIKAFDAFYQQLRKNYKNNLIPLDISLHMDETTPHIHFRYTLGAKDKFGHFMPNQTQALNEMGFDRQDTSRAKDRYNNALVSFSDSTRELFYQCCEQQGLVIDREVESPSRRQEEIHQFKFQKMQEDIVRLQKEVSVHEERARQATQTLSQTQSQLSALKDDLANVEKSRKELENEVMKLTFKKNNASINVHNLQVSLEKLQGSIEAAQQRYSEAQTLAEAQIEKLAALEEQAKGQYDAYDNRTIKKYETIDAQPEKKNFFGVVTQEASPRMYLVDADQLDEAERALGHVWMNKYNNTSIKDIEKKLSESEVVNELQQQIQEKTAEINRLTGENYQKDREIQKKDVQIGIYDSFLQSIGKKQEFDELEQQQKQQIHRGRH